MHCYSIVVVSLYFILHYQRNYGNGHSYYTVNNNKVNGAIVLETELIRSNFQFQKINSLHAFRHINTLLWPHARNIMYACIIIFMVHPMPAIERLNSSTELICRAAPPQTLGMRLAVIVT